MEDNKMPIVQIIVGASPVDMLKSMVSSLYVEWLDDLLEVEMPQESDYASKEEYEKSCKEFMADLVDQAKEYKGDIFKGVLESYNEFLTHKHAFDAEAKDKNARAEQKIASATSDMKNTGIMVLFLSLLFPQAFPIITLINGPRILLDARERKQQIANLEQIRMTAEQIKRVQDPLYWFTDSLRTDYHKSNKELEELRERALNGENVIQNLMELMSPERIGLPKDNILKELEFIFPEEGMEPGKELIKKEDKN